MIRMEDYLDPTYTFAEGTYHVLRGAAPLAGANYAAEVKALLAVLHGIPLNAPLLCISDALSALQVLWKPVLANGGRIRLGARSLVVPARVPCLPCVHPTQCPNGCMYTRIPVERT